MGIKYLTRIIREHSPDSIIHTNLHNLSGKTVGIDASLFIYQAFEDDKFTDCSMTFKYNRGCGFSTNILDGWETNDDNNFNYDTLNEYYSIVYNSDLNSAPSANDLTFLWSHIIGNLDNWAKNGLAGVVSDFRWNNQPLPTPPFFLAGVEKMNAITIAEMAKIGINISNPNQPVGTMSGGQRQTLAIARAIYFGAKILILDEPTSALGQKQQMEVLKTIKKVQELGNIAIILITHNEIHAQLIADRYTFLSLGEVIGSGLAEELGGDDIKRLMAGGAKLGDLESELAS